MYQLRVLGGLRLEGPSGPVTGRAAQRRRLALLTRLALARGAPLTRDTLCGLLWAESTDEQARQSLSAALYDLRRLLGEAVLPAVGDEVRLEPALLFCDAVAFEEAAASGRLEEGLSLYAGPLLEGVYLGARGTEEWGRWLESERARLARLHVSLLERLADAREAASDAGGAADVLLRLVQADPYSARTTLRLMHALERRGERARAIQLARVYGARMREELEAEPDDAVLELEERLRREASSPVRAAAPLPAPAQTQGDPASPAAAPDGAATLPPAAPAIASGARDTRAGTSRAVLSGAVLGALIGAAGSLLVQPLTRALAPALPQARLLACALVFAGVLVGSVATVYAPAWLARVRHAEVRRGRGRPAFSGASAGFVLGLGVALMSAYTLAPRAAAGPVAARDSAREAAHSRRLAVAPFANLTGDPSLDPLSRMTADWIIRGTMGMPGVEVADFWARARSDGSPEALRELAARSGATLIVSGSYYREGADVLLVARISDLASRKLIRELGPVRIERSRLVGGVEKLGKLVPGALAVYLDNPDGALAHSAEPPPTMEAYAAYLEGGRAFDAGDFTRARAALQRALALDSTFLDPLWLLATMATDRGECTLVDSIAARVERRKAVATEYLVLHVVSVRALCHHDRETEYQASRRLAQLMPGSEIARQRLAHAAMVSGRLREAAEEFARSDARRPPTPAFPWRFLQYCHVLHLLGRYDDELKEAERGRAQYPDFAARFFAGLHGLAALDRVAELRQRAEEARRHGPVDWPPADVYRRIAHELAYHGHPASARRFAQLGLAEVERMTPGQQRTTEGRVIRILLLAQLERWAEARRLLGAYGQQERVESIAFGGIYVTEGLVLALRGVAAARSGDRPAARAVLDTLARLPAARAESPGSCRELYQAGVLAALGERAAARERLRAARSRGALPASDVDLLHYDVMLRDLWHDPEVDRLFGPRD